MLPARYSLRAALLRAQRPGTMKKWGYGYEDVVQWNAEIIYGCNSGFGPLGEHAELGSFDMATQAYSGAMVAQGGGPSHKPMVIEHAIADEVGALNFSFAILAAVVSKQQTGKGQFFETSQLGAMTEYQGNGGSLARTLHTGAQRDDGHPPFHNNAAQCQFHDSEDKWFVVCYPQQKFWESVCTVVGREDMLREEKWATFAQRRMLGVGDVSQQSLCLLLGDSRL